MLPGPDRERERERRDEEARSARRERPPHASRAACRDRPARRRASSSRIRNASQLVSWSQRRPQRIGFGSTIERPQRERGVEADHEPGDVDRREARATLARRRAERLQRRRREDVRTARADVLDGRGGSSISRLSRHARDRTSRHDRDHRVGPVVERVVADDAASQLGADLGARRPRPRRRRPRATRASAAGSRGGARSGSGRSREERRQRRVRRHDRPCAGRSLVDGLVERRAGARLGGADDDVGGASSAGTSARGIGGSTRHASGRPAIADRARADARPRPASATGRGSRASTSSPSRRANASSSVASPFQRAVRPTASSRSGPLVRAPAAARRTRRRRSHGRSPRTFGVASGKLAVSTLSTTSASRVASRSDRLACQCVYQSSSGTRRDARQRRGEREKRRDHVHEHRVGAAQRRQRAPARRPRARPSLAAGIERPHVDVRRHRVPAIVAAQNDELVDARRRARGRGRASGRASRAPGRASA